MSNGKLLAGQQYLPRENRVRQFTERTHDKKSADALLGSARTEIDPIDEDASLVRVYAALDLASINEVFITKTNFQLPDILQSVTISYNENKGEGRYDENGFANSGGTQSAATSLSLQGNAQSSYSIVPTVSFNIRQVWANRVPTKNYLFFLAGPVTFASVAAAILAIDGTVVLDWPVFRPVSHTIVTTGQQVNLRVDVRAAQSASFSAGNTTIEQVTGKGYSLDGGVSINSITIPPTLHPLITLSDTERGNTLSAVAILNLNNSAIGPVTVDGSKGIGPVRATVSPTSLAATSPTGIPASGFYLLDVDSTQDEDGFLLVLAQVIDFSYFA